MPPITALLAFFTLTAIPLVTVGSPGYAAGQKVCTITDERLTEISGLVATESGYVAVNDSSDDPRRKRVFFLDAKCQVRDTVGYSGNGPRDPEDLALSPDDRTLWIADTGSNITSTERRSTVVLWSLPADGSAQPVLHRLAYPGGKTPDAEALLIAPDGTPLIVTKNVGPAEIYRPVGPLQKNNSEPVQLEKLAELTLPQTLTPNLLGQTGRVTVTGAARSPDGKRVVLRTYADAFEWDVPEDGDLVKAITTTTPRATALADPFGEAITYSPDGRSFLTVSDLGEVDSEEPVTILRYQPATEVVKPVGADADGGAQDSRSWVDRLSLDDITYLIVAIGVFGALLVGAGVLGIVHSRRTVTAKGTGDPGGGRPAARSGSDRRPGGVGSSGGRVYGRGGPSDDDRLPDDGFGPARPGQSTGGRARKVAGGSAGGRGGGNVYGGAPAGGAAHGGALGGGRPAAGGRSGTTYGNTPPGRRGGGGVYGGSGGGVYGGGPGRQGGDYPPEGGRINGYRHGPAGGRSGPGTPPAPGDYDFR